MCRQSLHDLGIGILHASKITAEAVFVQLFTRLAVPQTTGIGADLIGKNHGSVGKPSELQLEIHNYCKTVVIEANTMVDMVKKQILPAVTGYASELADTTAKKLALGSDIACGYEKAEVKKLSTLSDEIAVHTEELEHALLSLMETGDIFQEAFAIRDVVLVAMSKLRAACDEAETLTAEKYWPFPTYGDLLFGVR